MKKYLSISTKTAALSIFLAVTVMFSPPAFGGIYLFDVTDAYSATVTTPNSFKDGTTHTGYWAFDNRLGNDNKWFESRSGNVDMTVKFDNGAQLIQAYTITTGNDYAERQPKEWTLSGWDGTDWVVLDQQTDVAQQATNTKLTYYMLDNKTAYQEYKFDFGEHHGRANEFQVGEVELCRIIQGQDVTDYVKPTITSTNEVGYGHEFARLFDNSLGNNNKAGVVPVPTDDTPWTMTFTFPDSISPNIIGYRIASAADAPERDPANWTFHAGADKNGPTLSALEHRTAFFNNSSWLAFEMDAGRQNQLTWNITDVYNASATGMSQIGELEILEKVHIDRTNTNYMDVRNSVQVSIESVAAQGGKNVLNNNRGGDKWFASGSPGTANWLSLELAGTPVITRYGLTAVNEAAHMGRNPRDWDLQAWDDNTSDWVTLHSVTGANFRTQATQYFDFDNSTGYSEYRLRINDTESNGFETQIYNLDLYEVASLYQVSHLPGMVNITSKLGSVANQGPDMLLDGNSGTKWCHGTSPTVDDPHEIIFELGQAFAVQEYSFTLANDFTQRDPANWILSGSVDGDIWDVLDVVDGMDFPTQRHESYSFLLDNDIEYDFYKFEFLATRTDTNGIQLGEIGLWAPLGQSSSATPEPATWAMLLAGLAGLMFIRRKANFTH